MDPRLFIPGLAISVVGAYVQNNCAQLGAAGVSVPGRPPAWVFGVVWSFLYVTMGLSWSWSKNDRMYAKIVTLCCLWMVVYSCLQWTVLPPLILMTVCVHAWKLALSKSSTTHRLVALPLALWTTYASYLNSYETILRSCKPVDRNF
jgi:tryptophan-rich sensory protein